MRPNLINAIDIEIRQVQEAKTVYSGRRREPINVIRRATSFKLKSQIYFVNNEYIESAKGKNPRSRSLSGNILNADGYFIVRLADLKSINKELNIGDKIISYGNSGNGVSCEYFLVGYKDAAHYSNIGYPALRKWYFKDRN